MIVGTPKEIKNHEYRVGLTPESVFELVAHGHEVLGFSIQVFVEITLSSQSQEALNAFETAVMRFEEILECHLTTGQADYFLRVVARDVADYDNIHRNCLARLPGVSSMQTIFVLRPIREWQGYPIRA